MKVQWVLQRTIVMMKLDVERVGGCELHHPIHPWNSSNGGDLRRSPSPFDPPPDPPSPPPQTGYIVDQPARFPHPATFINHQFRCKTATTSTSRRS